MTWFGKVRLRLIVLVIGVPLAALGALSMGPSWLALPALGAVFYAVAVSVAKTGDRARHVCWTCGYNLTPIKGARSEHGVVCPSCGALNQHLPIAIADGDPAPEVGGDDDDAQPHA